MSLPVVVIGVSHKTAPVDVRERFAAAPDALSEWVARLAARPELEEVMFLSTCNRVEVIGLPKPSPNRESALESASDAIREVLRDQIGAKSVADLASWLYEKRGDEAVRHIFRVAASLDSMVLGEPQILGQVKDAFDAAVTVGALRNNLSRCVHRAFSVAKRVRSETQIGAGLVSISSVAVELTRRIFGDLGSSTVLLVGAGEMAEQAAKSLGKGANSIRVCNRSFDRAAALASTFGGTAAPLDKLEAELVVSDVIVASTASKQFVITKELVKRVMKQRKGRTLFFIDIAVPRNVDPTIHELDNVYVYNIDDLEAEVAENLKARQKEVAMAEAIVEAELNSWASWARGLNVSPTVVALRARTRGVLISELERSFAQRLKHLGEGDRAALVQMMESAANKLLHAPTTRLKAAASSSDAADLVSAVHHLFDLPESPERPGESQAPEDLPSDSNLDDPPSEKRLPH